MRSRHEHARRRSATPGQDRTGERQLAEQVGKFAARPRETEAEREALRITAETIGVTAADLEPEQSPALVLPGRAAHQQTINVSTTNTNHYAARGTNTSKALA
ncbi:hypothetical protein [Streptomyces sp. GESEQ-35]|uniref:hypothetical protein n=1 Tax=Streptomyces sp. GESEQ-35 TaxID=2812657 RepID=UPI001B330102|nr:hypothetical protein [Streptomyces sp. GESEQ-35]